MDIKDLAGLSKPLTKLIEEVSKGIGVWYRPRAIRNDAHAQAEATRLLDSAKTDADAERVQKMAVAFANARELLAAPVSAEVLERTSTRVLVREVAREENLEAVIDRAAAALPEKVSPEGLNADWRLRFFDYAENVCDDDMRTLWGKVLAGEIAQPGTFSLRTLEVLRTVSKPEAELLRKICSVPMNRERVIIPDRNIDVTLKHYGLNFDAYLKLVDAGLFSGEPNLQWSGEVPPGQLVVCEYPGVRLGIKTAANVPVKIQAAILRMTGAGTELARLAEPEPALDRLQIVVDKMRAHGLEVLREVWWPTGSSGQSAGMFATFKLLTDPPNEPPSDGAGP